MMELELYQELILAAVFSVLIAFLIGKIAVVGASEGELMEDVSDSADCADSLSAGGKLEGSELNEAEASGVRSGSEEEIVGVSKEKSDAGTDMMTVEEEFDGEMKMPVVVESLREEVERHVVGTEIKMERGSEGEGEEEGSLLHGEDEWEGIEKSEVEKLFGVATEYVRSASGAVALARLSSDVQLELYGLNKIATEGPCFESQPLPLNFSARAKWQAWQRLGNMSPEVAMEHYINLLSNNIPGWVDLKSEDAKCGKDNDSPVVGTSDSGISDLRSSSQRQLSSETQRKSGDHASFENDHTSEGSKILEQGTLDTGFTSTFILNLLSPTRGAFLSIYW
ncbi:acyl-CoA-binding domain-containing protein 5 isoform X2 [Dendrobium catenatum]|uniref:Acyl-CoA-binding domain-containing protein 3 n=1 Tax=Dendrobium catenatum TaxID=906689 RepID=A0A2I0WWF1_9ASPA|nr:acyl-CoA-binding domain-containing protein 5 isoform X2 [Dendrobium catenatum]PKU79973.1 Acyl-CoA-binding domain-containing protein 3 [Dendrobium catenatum]